MGWEPSAHGKPQTRSSHDCDSITMQRNLSGCRRFAVSCFYRMVREYSHRSYFAREKVSSEDKFRAAAANHKSCASCTVLPREADGPGHQSEYSMLMKSDTAEINFKGESWTEL